MHQATRSQDLDGWDNIESYKLTYEIKWIGTLVNKLDLNQELNLNYGWNNSNKVD